jgi:hypothetical protein
VLTDCTGLPRDPNLVSQTPCTDEVDAIQHLLNTIRTAQAGDADPANLSSVTDLEWILKVSRQGSDIPDRVHSSSLAGQDLANFAADDLGAQGGGGLGDPVDASWQIPLKLFDPIAYTVGTVWSVVPFSIEDVQHPR